MIAKFMNGRQDNWDIYLPAFLYAYRTSPHKSTWHTLYEAMLCMAPPSEDGAATELIPMGKCVAQEEARKLILANIKSEQQDQVESTPHWPRTWEAGQEVVTGDDVLQQVIALISPTVILNFIAKCKELSCKVLSEAAGKLPYLVDLGVVLLANDLLTKPFHDNTLTSSLCF